LVADPSKAHRVLGWQPTISFQELVELMVRSDMEELHKAPLDRAGSSVFCFAGNAAQTV